MGMTGRPFTPSQADGRHIPERDDALAPAQDLVDGNFEDYEDRTARWASIAVLGGLVLLVGLFVVNVTLVSSLSEATLIAQLVFGGITEIFVGCFIAYLVYPAAIPWAALAGTFTIADGVALAYYWGTPTDWGLAYCTVGLGAAVLAVAAWRAAVSWRREWQDDAGPSPS